MAKCVRWLILLSFLLTFIRPSFAVDARFDLVGPRINVRVTRNGVTLPIAEVPNLQPGDRIWLHPDLPPTQSVKYHLICVFLRGNTIVLVTHEPDIADFAHRIISIRDGSVFSDAPSTRRAH